MCVCFATTLKERTFSVLVVIFLASKPKSCFVYILFKKGSMLKYVFLLKGFYYVQIESTILLRVCFTCFLFFVSINSILSKFGGALRFLLLIFFLIIPFLFTFHKMLRNTTTTTMTTGGCEPRGSFVGNHVYTHCL